MVLRTLLIPKGQKEVEKGEGLVNTSRRREKRGKTQEASTVTFGVWNAVLSIYRESSQLISEKLWEQVIFILDLVQKYLKLSIKIYHIEFKNILFNTWIYILLSTEIYYWLSKYISDHALKYIKLPTKIFLIVFRNILDCIPK